MASSPLIFGLFKHHMKSVEQISRKYFELFGWSKRQNMKILELGSGTGTSLRVMEPLLARDYAEIVCVDKDAEMCKYLSSLGKHPRISVRQLNIETENLPNDLKGQFDLLFSSYCLTYVVNFRQAFINSSQLLKPDGELLFIWSKKNHNYEAYRTLSHTDKWAPYMKDFKNWSHPYNDDNATAELAKEFSQLGLKILRIEEFGELHFENENSQMWLDAFSSLDVMSARIPKSQFLEYKKDFDNLILQYVIEDKKANNTKVPFPTLVVAAKKVK